VAKALIITEKPSVARDIAAALGGFQEVDGYFESDRFCLSWAVGHLVELQEPDDINQAYKAWLLKDLPIIPNPFKLKAKPESSKLLNVLKKLLSRKDVTEVINACDAGREGELIFREILEYLELHKPTLRLWLQSMTPNSIRNGFAGLKPGSEFDRLGSAAQCRSEADWLIGINATRALTKRMKMPLDKAVWSAGRVQTPTLAMLVDRELEIYQHRPTPFWRLRARFQAVDHEYEGEWFDPGFKKKDEEGRDNWILDQARVEELLAKVTGQRGQARETRKPSYENAPPLFDLTSLQREGNRRFGMSARRTLAAAQRLYETHKLLTYPRTDSRALPSDYRPQVDQVLAMLSHQADYGKSAQHLRRVGLLNQERIFDDSAISDHFALIPTVEVPPADLGNDEARIYDLVARRFMAAFYPRATWTDVQRITEVVGESFRSTSRYLTEPGWYEVWGKDARDDKALPVLKEPGIQTLEARVEEDASKPPSRISEGRLLSLMEHAGNPVADDDNDIKAFHDRGLGTPATRADIIENLVARQYAMRSDKNIRPAVKGILLIDLLRRIEVERLASAELTGELEKHLRNIETGNFTRDKFMDEVTDYTHEIVDRARDFDYDAIFVGDPPVGRCPVCKERQVVEKMRAYSCEGYQGKGVGPCTFSVWKEKSGRYVDRLALTELLERGETALLDGFADRAGRSYKGRMVLDAEGKVKIVGETIGGEQPVVDAIEFPINPEPLGPCPLDPACEIRETSTEFRCAEICVKNNPKLKHGVILPRLVCKREITRDEAIHYFANGKTELIDDFVSRKGRNFKAFLALKENGRFEFEFLPRQPRGRKGEAAPGTEEGAVDKPAPAPRRTRKTADVEAAPRVSKVRTAKVKATNGAATTNSLRGTRCPGCNRVIIDAKAHQRCVGVA
jgi:DNA topoisomerase-3